MEFLCPELIGEIASHLAPKDIYSLSNTTAFFKESIRMDFVLFSKEESMKYIRDHEFHADTKAKFTRKVNGKDVVCICLDFSGKYFEFYIPPNFLENVYYVDLSHAIIESNRWDLSALKKLLSEPLNVNLYNSKYKVAGQNYSKTDKEYCSQKFRALLEKGKNICKDETVATPDFQTLRRAWNYAKENGEVKSWDYFQLYNIFADDFSSYF